MSKTPKKPSIYSPKLPPVALLNCALSVRSQTESTDHSPFLNRHASTPFSLHQKQESFDFRESKLTSPEDPTSKLRQSVPTLLKSEINAAYNGKIFTNSGKDFYVSFDIPKGTEVKKKSSLEGLIKKREEIISMGTWNDEQSANLKKLVFFFQDIRSKVTDSTAGSDFGIIMLRLLTQIENTTYNVLTSLSQTLDALFKESMKTSKQLQETRDNLRNFSANHNIIWKDGTEKNEKARRDNYLSMRNKESIGNSQHFVIQKLKAENDYLNEQLQTIIKYQDVAKISKELENAKADTKQKTEHYEAELRNKDTLLSRFEIMYNGTKRMNENLSQTNKNIEIKLSELYEEYKVCKESFGKILDERDMYRERTLMQLADYEGLKQQYDTLQEYFDKIKERYFSEKEKTKKLSDIYALQERLEASSTFSLEARTLENIQEALHGGKSLSLIKGNENETRMPEVDLKNYVFSKPAYSLLFSKQKQYLKMKESRLSLNFIGMLRAIYDSKYNEFLYADNHAQISRFPDFVYSWMGKFVLDNSSRKVRDANINDTDPNLLRNEMIALFQTPLSSRIWECITFKEFLDEVHTRDELLYFLHCRHLLFRGPQLNDPSSTFIFNYYIRLEWVEYVLEQLLGHKHSWDAINMMKAKFKERAKRKGGVFLIDSAFFLRILLEEYKKEKAEKLMVYKRSLIENRGNLSPRHGKLSINFEEVRDFFDAFFPSTTDVEKAELYRKCWVYNNGNVDVDAFLTVLNEENFFANSLNFAGLDEKLIPKGLGSNHYTQMDKVHETVAEQYQMISEQIEILKDSVVRLGVEKFLGDNQEFEKRIRTHFSVETKGFHGKDIHVELIAFFMHTYKLSNILLYTDGLDKGDTAQNSIKEIFSTFKDSCDRMIQAEDHQVKDFELNLKAKKLQKFFKSKLSSWYKLMKFILRNKLQKYYDEKGELRFRTKTT